MNMSDVLRVKCQTREKQDLLICNNNNKNRKYNKWMNKKWNKLIIEI